MKPMKWGASALRVLAAKVRLGSKLRIERGSKPVYLGRGVRLLVKPNGQIHFGAGAYIDDYSRLQVDDGASLHIGSYAYLNTNCRVVAAESIEIGSHTMLGPNVCVYDHDHVFDGAGVHGDLKSSPIHLGERCWIAANSLITRGVEVGDNILIGGASVVTDSLLEPGVYVGAPARLIRRFSNEKSYVIDGEIAGSDEDRV